MVDLNGISKRIAELGEKYKNTQDDYLNKRAYGKINEGIEAVEGVRKLTQELSSKVEEGNIALQGTMALVMKQKQQEIENVSEESLDRLGDMYHEKGGLVRKIFARVTGNRYLTLREGLNIVEKSTEQIPAYVYRLSEELSRRRGDLSEFRKELRGGIEELIGKKPLWKKIF